MPITIIHGSPPAGGSVDFSVLVSRGAVQSIPDRTNTAVAWTSEIYDTDNMHDNAVNNSRITFQRAGKFQVGDYLNWTASVVNFDFGRTHILLNGATLIGGQTCAFFPPLGTRSHDPAMAEALFAVADYVEAIAFQDVGSGGAAQDINIESRFWAQKCDGAGA